MSLSRIVSIGTVCYHPYTLDEAIHGIAATGCACIDLFVASNHLAYDLDAVGAEALAGRLGALNLSVQCLNANLGLMDATGVERTKMAISLAPKMGARFISDTIAGPDSHEEDLDLFMANIGSVADHAEAEGVTVCLETHGDKTGCGRQIVEVVRRVGHPRVKINYDTANSMFYGGAEPYDDLEAALPELGYVHLKDKVGGQGEYNFPPIGDGEIDFARVLNVLDDGGYEGPISIEMEFTGAWPPVEETHRAVSVAYQRLIRLMEPHW